MKFDCILFENQSMKKVVIIEDNKVIQHILKYWFTSDDFQVLSLENIDHLIAKIDKYQPDLIITDIMMPETDGAEMISVFSKIDLPKIVISSMDEVDVVYFAKRINAIAYYPKPINIKEIFEFIHEYFLLNNETRNSVVL